MAIAAGVGLLDEVDVLAPFTGGLTVGFGVARANDDTDFLDTGAAAFVEEDFEGGAFGAVLIDETL